MGLFNRHFKLHSAKNSTIEVIMATVANEVITKESPAAIFTFAYTLTKYGVARYKNLATNFSDKTWDSLYQQGNKDAKKNVKTDIDKFFKHHQHQMSMVITNSYHPAYIGGYIAHILGKELTLMDINTRGRKLKIGIAAFKVADCDRPILIAYLENNGHEVHKELDTFHLKSKLLTALQKRIIHDGWLKEPIFALYDNSYHDLNTVLQTIPNIKTLLICPANHHFTLLPPICGDLSRPNPKLEAITKVLREQKLLFSHMSDKGAERLLFANNKPYLFRLSAPNSITITLLKKGGELVHIDLEQLGKENPKLIEDSTLLLNYLNHISMLPGLLKLQTIKEALDTKGLISDLSKSQAAGLLYNQRNKYLFRNSQKNPGVVIITVSDNKGQIKHYVLDDLAHASPAALNSLSSLKNTIKNEISSQNNQVKPCVI